MNFIKTSLIAIVMASSLQASGIPSWFYPSAWILAAKRIYHSKKNPAQMAAARMKLERMQNARMEADNLARMHSVVARGINIRDHANNELIEGLRRDSYKFETLFLEKQNEWGTAGFYPIQAFKHFTNDALYPAIQKAEKECFVAHSDLPKSWQEQLKEQEQKLSALERNKTAQQREAEFKEWQNKKNLKEPNRPKFVLSQESMELLARRNTQQ